MILLQLILAACCGVALTQSIGRNGENNGIGNEDFDSGAPGRNGQGNGIGNTNFGGPNQAPTTARRTPSQKSINRLRQAAPAPPPSTTATVRLVPQEQHRQQSPPQRVVHSQQGAPGPRTTPTTTTALPVKTKSEQRRPSKLTDKGIRLGDRHFLYSSFDDDYHTSTLSSTSTQYGYYDNDNNYQWDCQGWVSRIRQLLNERLANSFLRRICDKSHY